MPGHDQSVMRDLSAPFRHRPKIGLVGFFGWGNYGDELFLHHWRRLLWRHFDASPVHDLLVPPYLSKVARAGLEDYDAYVIGGGDLIIPNGVSGLYWRHEWLDRPVYISGVGVSIWHHRRRADVVRKMSDFFRHPNVRYISARDSESAQWIRDHLRPHIPVIVQPDMVFASLLPRPQRRTDQKVLGISVRDGLFGRDIDVTRLGDLVSAARKRDYAVHLLVLGTGRQRARDLEVVRRVPFAVDDVLTAVRAEDITAAIGGLDAFASMKFHGLVTALMYGVPPLALTPNTKNVNLMASVHRLDLVGDLESTEDLATKLDLLDGPVQPDRVTVLVEAARQAQAELLRQLRIEVAPRSLLPERASDLMPWASKVLPEAVRLARRRVSIRRLVHREEQGRTAPR